MSSEINTYALEICEIVEHKREKINQDCWNKYEGASWIFSNRDDDCSGLLYWQLSDNSRSTILSISCFASFIIILFKEKVCKDAKMIKSINTIK